MAVNARSIGNQRRFLTQRIRKALEPHMWDSGYRKALDPSKGILGGTRALRLWIPQDANGKIIDKTWRIGGYVLDEIEGITEDGAITDSYCAIVTTPWCEVPIEDLVKVERWLARMLPAVPIARTEEVELPKAA